MATINEMNQSLKNAQAKADAGDQEAAAAVVRLRKALGASANLGPAPTTMEGLKRGALDVGQGLKQMYLMATDPNAAQAYTADVNKEIADYEARRVAAGKPYTGYKGTAQNTASFDFNRALGSTAVTAPLMFIPGGQSSIIPRMLSGAGAGALAGVSQFAPSGTGLEKAAQGLIGAGLGAVIPEIPRTAVVGATALGQLGRAGVRDAASVLTPTSKITQDLITGLQAAAPEVDFSRMTAQMQQNLLQDARQQLSVTGQLDPAALLRMRDYRTLGVEPTMGQATRDPRQYATERNTAGIAGVGEDLLTRFRQQPEQVRSALEKMIVGEAETPIAAGRSAIGAIGERKMKTGMYAELGKPIDDAFNAARGSTGADDVLPFSSYEARIAETVRDFSDKIPGPVLQRLGDFAGAEPKKAFSIREAAKMRELLNARIQDGDPSTALALGKIKRELDTFMLDQADAVGDAGSEAIQKFRAGAELSAKRAREFEPVSDVVSGKIAPEDFFGKYVLRGKVDDVVKLKGLLTRTDVSEEMAQKGAQAWDDIRGATVRHLLDKAAPMGEGFSQANFNNALKALNKNNMVDELFTPEEKGMLFTISRVSQNLFKEPVSGGVPLINRSGTGAALFNLMQKGSVVPGIGTLVQPSLDALKQQVQQAAAQRMLAGSSASRALQSAADAAQRKTAGDLTRFLPTSPFAAAVGERERQNPTLIEGLLAR